MDRRSEPPQKIGAYEVRAVLGAGAGGTAYRARDPRLERDVVIKLLHRDDEGGAERLLAEARLASAVDHPNVCAVYEAGEWEGRPFLVMQYVQGRTLKALLADGPISEALTLSVGAQIADGLAALHRHGVLHRDLKPANVMVTDAGAARILDFGLARRFADGAPEQTAEEAQRGSASSRFGTTAYMAPEQFAMLRSNAQSDLWALGVMLYEMATGSHPFRLAGLDEGHIAYAIQHHTVLDPRRRRSELSASFAEVVLRALARRPDDRFHRADAFREALRTLQRDAGGDDGSPEAVPAPAAAPLRDGLLATIAGRLLPTRPPEPPANAVAVAPFESDDAAGAAAGTAFAEAAATRLAATPGLVVRPPRMRHAAPPVPDPAELGRRLVAAFLLTGRVTRTGDGFQVAWRLLHVATDAVAAGGTVEVEGAVAAAAQDRIGEAVARAVLESGVLPAAPPPRLAGATDVPSPPPEEIAEAYLAARARLNRHVTRSSVQSDLEAAARTFTDVIAEAPDFAPAHASLGMALTRYVRYGFGGAEHLGRAQHHFDAALTLDPANIEAKLYRAYTLLWQGDKDGARADVLHLLRTAAFDAEVHVGAGVALYLDGLLGEARAAFGQALRLNPSIGPRVYHLRARVYLYERAPEPARAELSKGLALEPDHTLLRTTDGVWHLRHGAAERAVAILEDVLADDPGLRLARPSLALAYLRTGASERAAALMGPDILEHASADGEMAYRVASYHAAVGAADEALRWLRIAIYLGNHNAPWFEANPDWDGVRAVPQIRRTLDELAATQYRAAEGWRRALDALRR